MVDRIPAENELHRSITLACFQIPRQGRRSLVFQRCLSCPETPEIAVVKRSAQPRRAPQSPAAARPVGPRRAPTPEWGISAAGIEAPVVEVHRGDYFAGGRTLLPVSAERARAEQAGGVYACGVCRPDNVLRGHLIWIARYSVGHGGDR
ncbi:DUF6233 domain-containing protein [Streptomyces anulatus]